MPDELDALFPALGPILKSWGSSSSGSLPTDEHGGVTDEAVAEYVRSRMSNGQPVGPNPLNGAQQRLPQFRSGTTGAAPARSYVEPDDGSGGGPPPTLP